MLAQRPPVPAADGPYRKQLEYLYERRTTVDALIASLQKYDRFTVQPVPDQKSRLA
jgi:hypothetical protein